MLNLGSLSFTIAKENEMEITQEGLKAAKQQYVEVIMNYIQNKHVKFNF